MASNRRSAWVAAMLATSAIGCGGDGPDRIVNPTPAGSVSWWAPDDAVSGPTRLVSGTVVDTNLRPIAGARISSPFVNVVVDAVSDANGAFSFQYPALADLQGANLTADGYEGRGFMWSRGPEPVWVQVRLQPVITLEPGASLQLTLSEHDLSYYVGEPYDSPACWPCLRVRLPTDAVTTVRLRSADARVRMWDLSEREASPEEGDLVARSTGVVYVGLPLTAPGSPALGAPITLTIAADQ